MNIRQELKTRFDQAELLRVKENNFKITVENWDIQDLVHNDLEKAALRVISEGRSGSNSCFGDSEETLIDLLEGAEESSRYGDPALFDYSQEKLQQFEAGEEEKYQQTPPAMMLDFLEEVKGFMAGAGREMTLNISLQKEYLEEKIETTRDGDLQENKTSFSLMVSVPVPGGGSQLGRLFVQPDFFSQVPEQELQNLIFEQERSREVSLPETGQLPVIFSPRSLYFLMISLIEGISAANIYRETSPLLGRLGEKIFSERLSITDRPRMEAAGSRRSFDDEGIPTREQSIVRRGELQNYIYDLEYAARLEEEPKGNGLKRTLFSDSIDTPVSPVLINPVIEPGNSSREQMVEGLQEGIMVENIVGFHSSNYQQGHFSVQAHGFHIQAGEIKGRLENVMIAGNIYQDFQQVAAAGRILYPGYYGYYPYLLVEGIQVTGR